MYVVCIYILELDGIALVQPLSNLMAAAIEEL